MNLGGMYQLGVQDNNYGPETIPRGLVWNDNVRGHKSGTAFTGGTETRPTNYTVKVWLRVA